MATNSIKIANEFLAVARAEGQQLTPMKLIKLVYLAHGWSFPMLGRPLLGESVQAWQYGPVVPTLYHAVKHYRSDPITDLIVGDTELQPLNVRERELIRAVWQRYKGFSATQLSSLTHQPDTPWSHVWNERGQNATIPDKVIADHYQSAVSDAA